MNDSHHYPKFGKTLLNKAPPQPPR